MIENGVYILHVLVEVSIYITFMSKVVLLRELGCNPR